MSDSRILAVDTSVAVPLLVATHVAHHELTQWARGRSLALAGHACPETYSVLTRLPGDIRVEPPDARELIDANFTAVLALPPDLAATTHHELAAAGIAGGAVYDALVALAARAHGADLVTRDARALPTYDSMGVTAIVPG